MNTNTSVMGHRPNKVLALMSPEERATTVSRGVLLFDSDSRYYDRAYKIGRACQLAITGRILSDEEIQELEDSDKIPVQTPEGLSPVNSIVGMLDDMAKDGLPMAIGGEDAVNQTDLSTLLKWVQNRSQSKRVERQVAKDTIVTGFPTFAWLEPVDPDDPDKSGLTVEYQKWDSVIPSPKWKSWNLRDCDRIMRVKTYAPAQLSETFPDADLSSLSGYVNDDLLRSLAVGTSTERDAIFNRIRGGRDTVTREGEIAVVELLEFIRTEFTVFTSPEGEREVLPVHWTEEQLAGWSQEHPDWEPSKERSRILWSTVFTLSGVLLACGPHWLQSGEYPCQPMLPSMIDGSWMGIIEPSLDTQKSIVYARTEWIHSLRSVNNNLVILRDGTVADLDQFREERAKAGGTIVINDTANIEDIHFVQNTPPQNAFAEWMASSQDDIGRLIVERNFEGGAQSSQESSKVVNARIKQVASRLSDITQGWHYFRMGLCRLILRAAPYAIKEYQVARLFDPNNGVTEVEVNKPTDFDSEGNPVAWFNRLDAAEYDYVMVEADNSPTGIEQDRAMFVEFMQNIGNMPPEAIALAAANYPSKMVQEFGKQLQAQQEAAAQAPPPDPMANMKTSVTLNANELAGNTLAIEIAKKLGLIQEPPQQDQPMPEMPPPEMPPEGIEPDPAMTMEIPNE